jgi:hypothetical protein
MRVGFGRRPSCSFISRKTAVVRTGGPTLGDVLKLYFVYCVDQCLSTFQLDSEPRLRLCEFEKRLL